MRKFFYIIISVQLLSCQSKYDFSEKFIKNSNGEIYIAIVSKNLPIDDNENWLTREEVKCLDTILIQAVANMNRKNEERYYKYKFDGNVKDDQVKLEDYKRQYLPFTNQNGEKEVWVNCACNFRSEIWMKEIYTVDGGGKCYFNGYINLAKKTFRDFSINAPM